MTVESGIQEPSHTSLVYCTHCYIVDGVKGDSMILSESHLLYNYSLFTCFSATF